MSGSTAVRSRAMNPAPSTKAHINSAMMGEESHA
jgi:hypothetical protein